MKNIDFKSLIESAERAKHEPVVVKFKLEGLFSDIILELKKIEIDPNHLFSKSLRWTIIDSMPWNIPFFRELTAFLGEHDKFQKAMDKLKKT